MNKHIELVKKWLAGEDVSKKRLRNNRVAAYAAYAADAAEADDVDNDTYDVDAEAAAAAPAAACVATSYANEGNAELAAYWVKLYEEFSAK